MVWERVVKTIELKVKDLQTLAGGMSVLNARYTVAADSSQAHPESYREARKE